MNDFMSQLINGHHHVLGAFDSELNNDVLAISRIPSSWMSRHELVSCIKIVSVTRTKSLFGFVKGITNS